MSRQVMSIIVRRVVTVDENRSAMEAALIMTEEFIGSVVVTKAARVVGIFTERDLMMRVIGQGLDPARMKIRDVMTKDPITILPEDTADQCLALMKDHRCRHLLVFEGEEFVGIVSLRDIVHLLLDEKEEIIGHLERYITA